MLTRTEGEPRSHKKIQLVSQMTAPDFARFAQESGGEADPNSTIDDHIAEINFPSLRSRITFAKEDPGRSNRVDSIIFTNWGWGRNKSLIFLENCATVSDRDSISLVATHSLPPTEKLGTVDEIMEVVTLANGEITHSQIDLRTIDTITLKSGVRKALSLILDQRSRLEQSLT